MVWFIWLYKMSIKRKNVCIKLITHLTPVLLYSVHHQTRVSNTHMKQKVFILFLITVMAGLLFQVCGALALVFFGVPWHHISPYFYQINYG
jgi:hypothetical protein